MMLRTNYVDYLNVKCCKHNVAVFTLDAAVTIGSAVICQTSMFTEYECYLTVFNILVLGRYRDNHSILSQNYKLQTDT